MHYIDSIWILTNILCLVTIVLYILKIEISFLNIKTHEVNLESLNDIS